MKDSFENSVDIKGYVFNHTLTKKVSRKGVSYIGGVLNVATDKDAMNVVPVNFTYVTETYSKSGKPNATYSFLEQIIDNNNTYELNGASAAKVRISGDIECNDFVTRDGEMASPKRIRGSFVHAESGDIAVVGCAKFKVDMLIEGYQEVEDERNGNFGRVRGYVFNFRNDFLPVDFTVRSNGGMSYFDKADVSVSEPLLTQVWGDIVATTIVKTKEVENAFGAPDVQTTTRTLRAWDIVGAANEPYEFGNEADMTAADVTKGKAAREEYLVTVRRNHEEYQASRNGSTNAFATTAVNQSPTSTNNFRF